MDQQNLSGLVLNAALIILGLFLLFNPGDGIQSLVSLIAAALVVYGIVRLVRQHLRKEVHADLVLPLGALILGALLLLFSAFAAHLILIIFPLVFSILLLVIAALHIKSALTQKKSDSQNWWISLVIGLVSLIACIVLLANLRAAGVVVITVAGIYLILLGGLRIGSQITGTKLS
ncbi:MAG: DUF308 domain-containing protein [Christensenellales bacterium]|jgi:uncharacterized membrane protein HdeD (DUF308 family)